MAFELNLALNAIKLIYPKELFWIFDLMFQLKYSNCSFVINIDERFIKDKKFPILISGDFLLIDETEIINKKFQFSKLVIARQVVGYYLVSHSANEVISDEVIVSLLINSKTINLSKQLTAYEKEIVTLIRQGYNYKTISQILTIVRGRKVSESTIGNTIRQYIYPKLGVCNLYGLKTFLIKNWHILSKEDSNGSTTK